MISMWEPLVQAMASFQSSSCEDKLGLVRQLEAGASLHPHHSLVRDYVELATYIRDTMQKVFSIVEALVGRNIQQGVRKRRYLGPSPASPSTVKNEVSFTALVHIMCR